MSACSIWSPSISVSTASSPGSTRTGNRVSNAAARRTNAPTRCARGTGAGSRASRAYARHESRQCLRPRGDDFQTLPGVVLPVVRAFLRRACQQGLQAARDGADRRERVVDFVSQHPDQAAATRRVLPLAATGSRPPARATGAACRPPGTSSGAGSSARPCGPGKSAASVRWFSPASAGASSSSAADRPISYHRLPQQLRPGPVDQPEPRLVVEGKHRHLDLRHHGAQQRRGFRRRPPAVHERLAQRVDLLHHLAQHVIVPRPPRPQRIISLPQRRQQVGQGLHGVHDLIPHRHHAPEPRADHQHPERSTAPWAGRAPRCTCRASPRSAFVVACLPLAYP